MMKISRTNKIARNKYRMKIRKIQLPTHSPFVFFNLPNSESNKKNVREMCDYLNIQIIVHENQIKESNKKKTGKNVKKPGNSFF